MHSYYIYELQKDVSTCPLRNIGRGSTKKLYSGDEEEGADVKVPLYLVHNSAESIEKIKQEYHIKDEAGGQCMVKEEGGRQVKKEDKDKDIKAEPGHHAKISSGLFPSDVKIETSSSKSSSASSGSSRRTAVKLESAHAQKEGTEAEMEDSLKCETSPHDSPAPAVMERGQRRGRSAHSSAETHDDDENVVFLKRRGAILR
jgi:hypothetical protein